jgi:hypothetical protein
MGKILTLDNLRKRHVIVMNRCCMCKRSKDMVDHLLLHCEVASALWSAIFGCFGMSWVMPRWVSELFVSWWSLGGGGVPWFGRWCLLAFFGVYGGREIIGALRTLRGPWRTFYPHVFYYVSWDYSFCVSVVD